MTPRVTARVTPRVTQYAEALETLGDWRAPDGGQESLRDAFLAHLTTQADGLTRACFPDHLTAGLLVLSADRSQVLLNLHRKAGRWFAFGGHIEPDDPTLADAALREGTEESGLTGLAIDPRPVHLDLHTVEFCDPRGPVRHLDVRFTALAPEIGPQTGECPTPAISDESIDVRWWPVGNLPTEEPGMHELVRLALAADR